MKTLRFLLLAIVLCAASVSLAGYEYYTGIEVRAVNDFYAPLSPYGKWVELPRYGWCWYPAYTDQDWRPYAVGQWQWTDSGWYWVSEEPWAWATYHYGRWLWDSYYGWVWLPGVEWAPAWVSWREGGEYVGWAPLPPECDFAGRDVIYADQIVIAPQTFVFVEQRRFCDHIQPSVLVFNQTIINKTVNITKIQRVNHTVVNEGPNVQAIAKINPGKVQVASKHIPRPQYVPRDQRQIVTLPSQFQSPADSGKLKNRPGWTTGIAPVGFKNARPPQINIQSQSDPDLTPASPDDTRPGKGLRHRTLASDQQKPERLVRKQDFIGAQSPTLNPY
jgi:hypothetical protein